MERFSNKIAIAPTASISIIAGNASPGIEPIAANVFLQKTLSGSFSVRNRHLQKLLAERGQDNDEVWSSITLTQGSVQVFDGPKVRPAVQTQFAALRQPRPVPGSAARPRRPGRRG